MRPSSLDERLSIYTHEFDVSSVSRWIGERGRSMKFAMIPGRHTGIVTPAHAKDKDNVAIIDTWTKVADIREFAIEYLPEGLYYDRNRYSDVRVCAECHEKKPRCDKCYNYDGQQLAFDLDPENIDCPYHGRYSEAEDFLSACSNSRQYVGRRSSCGWNSTTSTRKSVSCSQDGDSMLLWMTSARTISREKSGSRSPGGMVERTRSMNGSRSGDRDSCAFRSLIRVLQSWCCQTS